jgi:gamma-glutamyltranspeptidase/glutathione hydrolase
VGEVQAPDRAGRSVTRSLTGRLIAGLLLALLSCGAWAADRPGRAGIASQHFLASEAGHEILEQGGNAFDAAIAVSAVLAVVEPTSSGLGGGGFWMLHRAEDGFQTMIDARETAPGAAHRDMYLDEEGEVNRDLAVNGPLAGGIPGEVAGMEHLARNYGRLPLAASLQPAIRIAREGFAIDKKFHTLLGWRFDTIKRWPAAAEAFLADGEMPEIGHVVRLPDLAWVLEQIAEYGAEGFYTGPVAEKLVEGVRVAGGIWTLEDLANYRVVEREPIRTLFGGYELVTAPPPSSGGIAIAEILNIIEPWDVNSLDPVLRTHLLVEAMRRAYRDRAIHLGDPDFVEMPIEMLTSRHYAAGLRASIRPDRATPSSMLAGNVPPGGGTDTTHFSIIDADGNMVAGTLTVNTPFGSAYMPPGTGLVVNNEMNDFSAKKGTPNEWGLIGFVANEIQPGKRLRSPDGRRPGRSGTGRRRPRQRPPMIRTEPCFLRFMLPLFLEPTLSNPKTSISPAYRSTARPRNSKHVPHLPQKQADARRRAGRAGAARRAVRRRSAGGAARGNTQAAGQAPRRLAEWPQHSR